jgi:cell division transport system permease protein
MTWMVIAIALVLPAALYLGLHNVQLLGQGWQDKTQMSVYVQHQAKPLAVEQLQQRLEAMPEVASVSLITPEAAKQEFQQYSGLGEVLKTLEVNPLPALLTVDPASTYRTPEQLTVLQNKLQALPLVDFVQLDITWLRRLHEMMNLAQHIVLVLASLLAFGVLLIIGNTIRLAIENRRNEIIVVKMVGGTDGFVRRPFLYSGFWYGLGGGIFAGLLLLLAGAWLSTPLESLMALYGSEHSLTWVNLESLMLLLIGSGLLGWMGAWLAVARHLKHIEPE